MSTVLGVCFIATGLMRLGSMSSAFWIPLGVSCLLVL